MNACRQKSHILSLGQAKIKYINFAVFVWLHRLSS